MRAFRERLGRGEVCLGASVSTVEPAVTEALGPCVDFLWIDLEHTTVSLESLQSHLIAARAAGTPAIVRVPGSEVWFMKRVLDTGAPGIVVPQVRTAEEVREVVAACRYPPSGRRGYGPRRAAAYGHSGNAEYLEAVERDLFLTVQIENVEALENLDAILAVPGLDSIFIGPYDLAFSMGLRGEVKDHRVREAMETIIAKARARGLPVGMGMGPEPEFALRAAAMGARWIQVGGDLSFMVQFAREMFGGIRKRLV